MLTDNKTAYAIQNEAERCAFIIWSTIVFVASLIGDTLILVATIKYHAIKVHKVIVAVMQHLAMCDLLQAVFKILPTTLALVADRWVVGDVLCHVEENLTWLCGGAGATLYLTSALSTLKLITVQYPLKTGAWTAQLGHKVCAGMWFLVLGLYAPCLVKKVFYVRDRMFFSYRYYKCYILLTDLTWIGVSLGAVISYLTLTITSVLILIVARRSATRHGERLRWMGVATVILTVGLYQLSQLPMTVVIISHYVLGVEPSSTTFRASMQVTHLNIMANFFVYALTVRSFRTFLKLKMSSLLSFLRMSRRLRRAPIRCEDLPLRRAVSKKEGEASLMPLSAAKPLGLQTRHTIPCIQDGSV